MKKSILILVVLLINATFLIAQSESDFYQKPTKYIVTQNLVKDYNVDNSFDTNDSEQLQKAIDYISENGGGKLIVPKGNYTFSDIKMKSDVHIEFDPKVIIRPSKRENNNKNYSIFDFGSNSDVVQNVSLTSCSSRKKYTVDLTHAENFRVVVFALRNVDNFLFSGVLIKDKQTLYSSFTLGITPYEGKYYYPKNGVIKNATTTDADYGYGLVQSQASKNVFYKNVGGQGGVTLRLETGAKLMNNLQVGGNHDVFAKNVACHDGNSAVMISPHAMKNGIVTVDGVTAVNCGFAVRIGGAFIASKYNKDKNIQLGTYDSRSSVKNVTATFGTSAQVKPKHMLYSPKI
jgi:hypothetical protein